MKESVTTGDFNDHFWDEDTVQYARLIVELDAAGVFQDRRVVGFVCASMDLTTDEIWELLSRARTTLKRAIDT